MGTPAAQREASARSDVALYALLELSKALSSEFDLDKLLAIIVEKASAVVEAERTRIILDDELPENPDRHLTNDGKTLRAPVIDSRGNLLGILESVNKTTQAGFDAHDESLMHALAAHVAVAIERARLTGLHLENQRYEQSLRLASEIQMRMLPSGTVSLPDSAPFAIHAFIRPARQIGGDLYDFFWNDESLYFCIGDVTGKGVGAALVMAMTKTLFRAYAVFQYDPARLMSAVSARLNEETDPSMFVTGFCGFLNLRNGRLLYSNAGHEPPIIVRGKSVERLSSKAGVPLGALRSFKYVVEKTVLQPGDALFLFTDGVTEASNRAEELFGGQRLREVVEHCADSEPSTIVSNVAAAVERFAGGTPQSDDIAMLAVQYYGAHRPVELAETFRRDIAELDEVFDLVERFFASIDAGDAARNSVALAAEEIFTNLVRYNAEGGDQIEIHLKLEDDSAVLRITDFNAPPFDVRFDAPKVEVGQPLEERSPGGLGLFLVKTMMDRVEYSHEGGNSTVTLYKRVQ
jgi:sigma-B regulation protein RsbU (phosphoserine phosphatase)